MSTKEWMHQLPEALLQDERILSGREKELLAGILRQARTADSTHRSAEILARAVGETVMQRAFTVLGDDILKGLEASAPTPLNPHLSGPLPVPTPPAPRPGGPRPPTPDPPPSPNGIVVRRVENTGAFLGPQLPSETVASGDSVPAVSIGVMDVHEKMAAECVVFEEFLVPDDLDDLLRFAQEHEAEFHVSQVLSPALGSRVDHEHRRSRVLSNPGEIVNRLVERARACLPRVLPKLGLRDFAVSGEEAQITASNHGDFFRWHSDNSQDEIGAREITFVYFFHREPKRFHGGELRIYDSYFRDGGYVPGANYRAVVPRQNQIVFFRSSLTHEITPVECPSGEFGDSRFTVNGWFHR